MAGEAVVGGEGGRRSGEEVLFGRDNVNYGKQQKGLGLLHFVFLYFLAPNLGVFPSLVELDRRGRMR